MSQKEREKRFGTLAQKTALKYPIHRLCKEKATYIFFKIMKTFFFHYHFCS